MVSGLERAGRASGSVSVGIIDEWCIIVRDLRALGRVCLRRLSNGQILHLGASFLALAHPQGTVQGGEAGKSEAIGGNSAQRKTGDTSALF